MLSFDYHMHAGAHAIFPQQQEAHNHTATTTTTTITATTITTIIICTTSSATTSTNLLGNTLGLNIIIQPKPLCKLKVLVNKSFQQLLINVQMDALILLKILLIMHFPYWENKKI